MTLIETLQLQYLNAGFSEISEDKNLVFSKNYKFCESDGNENEVTIEVCFSREYPLIPPQLNDPKHVLTSMHSLNGFQCWARFSDIFPQVGLGLIAPTFVEEQISKLINSHIKREYYTVNESPEFAATFTLREAVDHAQFYVTCEVLDKVVEAGSGKVIGSTADYIQKDNIHGVTELPDVYNASAGFVLLNRLPGNKKRVYFLNVRAVQHFDWRNDDIGFLCWLEQASGIELNNVFLQNIKDEIFVVIVFYNESLKHHDIVAFRKIDKKLTLLPHARVSSRTVLFSRHSDEAFELTEKKIALLGIGAIGSTLGMTLLQSGIGALYITDNDYVDLENTSRSIYEEANVGMLKTDAFKQIARRKDTDFGERVTVLKSYNDFAQNNPDLIIVCIGNLYEEYMISQHLRKIGFDKVVFVFGQNDCTWGGIYFQDYKQLGCQHCLFLHQSENNYLKIPYVPYFSEAVGCGNPSYISSPANTGLLANLASKLIIERLIHRQPHGPNYFVWQSNPEPSAWTDCHTERYSLKKYKVDKHAECKC